MNPALHFVFLGSGLPRRYCEAGAPMPMADRNRYQWGHPDAVEVRPFFNLVIYRCPHCQLEFHAAPRPATPAPLPPPPPPPQEPQPC